MKKLPPQVRDDTSHQKTLMVHLHISVCMHRETNGKFINQAAFYDSGKWARIHQALKDLFPGCNDIEIYL